MTNIEYLKSEIANYNLEDFMNRNIGCEEEPEGVTIAIPLTFETIERTYMIPEQEYNREDASYIFSIIHADLLQAFTEISKEGKLFGKLNKSYEIFDSFLSFLYRHI